MRNELQGLLEEQRRERGRPHHAGLAHERYAPMKEDLDAWEGWLSWVERSREPEGYAVAFHRWKESLRHATTASFTARAEGRLLVGHGNASPTGVGLTLHHTWGVPVIPGSSLKGVLASYLRAVFDAPAVEEACRRLFGVPGEEETQQEASAGEVLFHDALWVSRAGADEPMLARDVLTVHQKGWYGGKVEEWPNDYDSPNPVAFLTVRPGGRFLVALSLTPGADAEGEKLLRWAAERLGEALRDWGVGGKTAAGYGRLEREGALEVLPPRTVVKRSPLLDECLAWLALQREGKVEQRRVLDVFEAEWLARLRGLSLSEREECRRELRSLVRNPKLTVRRDALLESLCQGVS
ncbi:type III-B CRISPR module RAMP protein Cmr6 [Pyxidicoccus sp. 3LG]